ncbi:MAG: methionyl-tRNA formyltransferase [Micavibrio sp.]
MKVVFMGTPDFSVPALQAILDSQHEVLCVYSQPPRPKGRGQHLQKSPVQQLAESAGIPVCNPLSFKKDETARQEFIALNADIAVVAAYGLILPDSVLTAPRYGCVNIHASLLPRWRGASPIQRAILAGDEMSGITLMQMEAGLDTGPIIEMRDVPIGPATTTPELHDTLAGLGGAMIVPFLDRLSVWNRIESEPQDDSKSCYAPLLKREDGRVEWAKTATEIGRQIRALNPWPGVWAVTADGVRLKILEAALSDAHTDATAGTVLDKSGAVSCGAGGILVLKTVQPENGKAMDVAAAINGGYLRIGTTLS